MSIKKQIQEVIVVEGHHDTDTLRKYFECDTIETSGLGLNTCTLEKIAHAQKTRGVIIFTDPDSPGNRIRHAINQAIPGCKNAFVNKKDAHTTKKVGIEHASYQALLEALEHVVTYTEYKPLLTARDMLDLGLTGNHSKEIREKVGAYYHIGFANAKTMLRRLNFLKVSKEEIQQVIEK